MSQSELRSNLRQGAEEVVQFFSSLQPVAAETPLTPSEHPGGRPWSPKDHLAHLVQREFEFLPIAQRIIAGESNPLRLEERGSTEQERTTFVNRQNQAAVEGREHQSFPELLAEFASFRSQLVSLIDRMSSDDLKRHVEVAPDRIVPTGVLLTSSDRHAKAHLQMLEESLVASRSD